MYTTDTRVPVLKTGTRVPSTFTKQVLFTSTFSLKVLEYLPNTGVGWELKLWGVQIGVVLV